MTHAAWNCDDTADNVDATDSWVNIVNRGTIDSGAGENRTTGSCQESPFMTDHSATRSITKSNLRVQIPP